MGRAQDQSSPLGTPKDEPPVLPAARFLTDTDLEVATPSREREPVRVWHSLRVLFGAYELLLTLTERDLRVRYKQALLGAIWAVLQPLFLMVIFSVVFGKIAKVGSEGAPYPIFSYTALVPWGFFSNSVNYGANNVTSNAWMVRKIYLPRDVLPLSAVLSAGVDFLASAVILLGMLVAYGYRPNATWIAYPVVFAVLMLFSVSAAFLVSLVTVYFRDTRYAIPTLLQLVLYATPIAYPIARVTTVLPSSLRTLYPYLNVFAPIMDGFRRILIHREWPQWGPLGVAAAVGAVILYFVYRWYKRLDPTFADVI